MKIYWAVPNIQTGETEALKGVLESGYFSMGNEVKTLEEKISTYLDIDYAVAVNTGTAALDTALKCINIKKDDEVIIPALTYFATGSVVLYNNAKPIFVDIDDTLNIDPYLLEEKITDKTKAIINIDLAGNVSNYSELQKISKQYNIPLIVDGAQSFGSEYHGVKCCTHGLINTTSFHAAKILTTIEGGMVFTRDKELYSKAQSVRCQGESSKYIHQYLGNNYRMMDIVAVMGSSQIDRIKDTLEQRKLKVNYYKENLKNIEYPSELTDTINCNLFFLILVENRDKLNKYLNENGIETRIIYPMPINEQPIFRELNNEVFPVAKEFSKKVISLPLHHELTTDEQDYIIEKINTFGG